MVIPTSCSLMLPPKLVLVPMLVWLLAPILSKAVGSNNPLNPATTVALCLGRTTSSTSHVVRSFISCSVQRGIFEALALVVVTTGGGGWDDPALLIFLLPSLLSLLLENPLPSMPSLHLMPSWFRAWVSELIALFLQCFQPGVICSI